MRVRLSSRVRWLVDWRLCGGRDDLLCSLLLFIRTIPFLDSRGIPLVSVLQKCYPVFQSYRAFCCIVYAHVIIAKCFL